ncbi:DUF6192 family protein [Streptomyces umbrinus]|uniref:DUF6192 family protein n=1 Tax=Streptomyces umbrinus TaxID=67370 RepID=UPI003428EF80
MAESLRLFADEIGLSFYTVRTQRWVAAQWPAERRQAGVSWEVHRILAHAPDRFELIRNPPLSERTGRRRWSRIADQGGSTLAHRHDLQRGGEVNVGHGRQFRWNCSTGARVGDHEGGRALLPSPGVRCANLSSPVSEVDAGCPRPSNITDVGDSGEGTVGGQGPQSGDSARRAPEVDLVALQPGESAVVPVGTPPEVHRLPPGPHVVNSGSLACEWGFGARGGGTCGWLWSGLRHRSGR